MVLTAPAFTNVTQILAHYIPRVSTVIFIEVFSFFFLRLYKATLAESKFYQIELLELTSLDVALQAAIKLDDPKTVAAVISETARGRKSGIFASSAAPSTSRQSELDGKTVTDLIEKTVKLVLETVKVKGHAG
jgi:hypothetical protein